MTDDPRCCGTGTCIINADGQCWCGQQWDGTKMCHPPLQLVTPAAVAAPHAAPVAAPVTTPVTAPDTPRPQPGD